MNTMNVIVWMLPVIFMIHDFEEIMMVEVWSKRYKKEIPLTWPQKQPFGLNYMQHCLTSTFSIAVEFEFLLFSLVSLLSVIFQSYFLWYSAFLGLVLHMILIHVPICFRFRHYVPGVTTSIIFLVPCIWVIYISQKLLLYHIGIIFLACLVGIVLFIFMVPTLHKLMGYWSKWLHKYYEV